jgi:hypothetical protein
MMPPIGELTKDGFDLQFGTNVIGHWLFTMELLPLLEAGAKSPSDGKSRVVTTSSLASELADSIRWDTLEDGSARRKISRGGLYAQSKFVSISISGTTFTTITPYTTLLTSIRLILFVRLSLDDVMQTKGLYSRPSIPATSPQPCIDICLRGKSSS